MVVKALLSHLLKVVFVTELSVVRSWKSVSLSVSPSELSFYCSIDLFVFLNASYCTVLIITNLYKLSKSDHLGRAHFFSFAELDWF